MGTRKLLIDWTPVTMQLIESGDGPKKCIARGEFGRAGTPTANKRYYPRSVVESNLKRLVEKIERRQVLGELDHPCLISSDFRVLTVAGWKPFTEIKPGDKVWSRSNGKAVESTVDGIVNEEYSGAAYRIKGRNMDSGFTPGHRFMLVARPDQGDFSEIYVTAEELASNQKKYSHSPIPKCATWRQEEVKTVTIPGHSFDPKVSRFRNNVAEPLELDSKVFAAFMGLYLSEGGVSADTTDNYNIHISQKTGWSKKLIQDEVLSKFPATLQWSEHDTGFYLADVRLYNYLQPLGNTYTKRVPDEVKKLHPAALQEFVYWFMIGDGQAVTCLPKHFRTEATEAWRDSGDSFKASAALSIRENGSLPYVRRDVFSVSERLVRDIHECVTKAGGSGTISKVEPDEDYQFAGRMIEAKNKVPLWQLHLAQSENMWLDPRFTEIERIEHTGRIYCLSVTHGNFYMEQNGKSFWTGNSDGRTALSRVSHVITGLSLDENGVVIGEAETIPTSRGKDLEALMKAGIQIGVSSRGYGSTVTNKDGVDEVQEDYKLVTYDFVAEPANITSYPEIVFEEKEDEIGMSEPKENSAPVSKEELSELVLRVVAEERDKIRNEERAKLQSDPDVALSRSIVDQIKSLVQPVALPEDTQRVVKAKDSEILKLSTQLSEQKLKIDGLEEKISEVAELARSMGYRYYLERQISGDPNAELIRKLVGDPASCENKEEVAERVESVRADFARQEKTQAAEERRRGREAQIAAEDRKTLANKTSKMEEALHKAVELNKVLAIRLYTEERLTNHPQSGKIRALVESARPMEKEEVDALIERNTVSPRRDSEQLAAVRARVRAANKGGQGPTPMDEEAPAPKRSMDEDNYNGLGISLAELRKTAGVSS